jgi:hypothetical protein
MKPKQKTIRASPLEREAQRRGLVVPASGGGFFSPNNCLARGMSMKFAKSSSGIDSIMGGPNVGIQRRAAVWPVRWNDLLGDFISLV